MDDTHTNHSQVSQNYKFKQKVHQPSILESLINLSVSIIVFLLSGNYTLSEAYKPALNVTSRSSLVYANIQLGYPLYPSGVLTCSNSLCLFPKSLTMDLAWSEEFLIC